MTARFSDSLFGRLLAVTLFVALCSPSLFAQEPAATKPAEAKSADDASSDETGNAGESELDEAVINRIDAETSEQLEAVSALLKSALRKGLDDENETFAKKMLAAVLLQRSQGLAAAMMQARGRRQAQLRDEVLRGLDEAVKHDPALVKAYLMIARMNLLPGGDKGAITEATSHAIELLEDDPVDQSAAYVLRALTQDDNEKKLADLNSAVKADPNNLEAFQARAALRLQQNDVEGAIADLELVLLKDPTNEAVAEAVVTKLRELDRVEDALGLITKSLTAKPSEGLYRMRADLYRSQEKYEQALSDLNKAIAMQPKDVDALIQRAEIALEREDVKSAKEDFRSALKIAPQAINAQQAIALRADIAMHENRLADAINDFKLLVERDPGNIFRRMQLANAYSVDKRPRKAIDVMSAILDTDPKNTLALRTRGDTLLSVGDHIAAVQDYEKAIEAIGNIELIEADERQRSDAAAIYNNLSWVLATSPNDAVRDGKRAVELGNKAAKLSEYKEAHILSTLAAGYAEAGDFEKAIEWSTKSVEIGREEEHAQIEQLELELESYRKGEAWREKQETEENVVPILSPEDLIDT
jgi:tetratricopeptide (TPR) repeat protein